MDILVFNLLLFIVLLTIAGIFDNEGVNFFLIITFIGINFYIFAHANTKLIKQEKSIIYSTANHSQFKTSGSFILGSGTIDSEEMYLANTKIDSNTYKRIYIPVKKTVRVIDENLTDTAIYIKYKCRTESFGIRLTEGSCYNSTISNKHPIYDKLYIPSNAIVKTMNFQ